MIVSPLLQPPIPPPPKKNKEENFKFVYFPRILGGKNLGAENMIILLDLCHMITTLISCDKKIFIKCPINKYSKNVFSSLNSGFFSIHYYNLMTSVENRNELLRNNYLVSIFNTKFQILIFADFCPVLQC